MMNTNFRKIELLHKDAMQTIKRVDASPKQSKIMQSDIKSLTKYEPNPNIGKNEKAIDKDYCERDVQVRVKCKDREDWKMVVHVRIGTQIKAKHSEATLVIELTCEEDPFFLYIFECDETEFYQLKSEQYLRVDFQKFPQMLEQLLCCCMENSQEGKEYACQLNIGQECTLSIVENNQYRQLTHLCLKLKPGDDENVKKFLANQLNLFKKENEDLKSQLLSTENKLSDSSNFNAELKEQFDKVKEENRIIVEKMKYEQKNAVDEIKDNSKAELDRVYKQFDAEKKKLIESYESKLQKINIELDELKANNKLFKQKNNDLEKKEAELTHNLGKAIDELKYYKQDLDSLKTTNKSLDNTKSIQEKSLTELQIMTQSLTKQLQDKEELVAKISSLLDASKSQNQHLEEMLSILKGNATKMEEKLQSSAQEIIKGNTIITKQQADIKSYKQKIKLKSSELLQQETVITQQKKQIDDIMKESQNQKRDLEKKDDEVQKYKSVIDDQANKISEEAKALKSSQQMIGFLNAKINEAQKPSRPSTIIGVSSSKSFLPPNYKPAYSTVETVMESASKSPLNYIGSASIMGTEIKELKYSPLTLGALEKPLANTLERHTEGKPGMEFQRDADNILPIKYTKPS